MLEKRARNGYYAFHPANTTSSLVHRSILAGNVSHPQMAQAEPSPLMEQSEPTFPMAEQSCGLDQPLATLPAYGGFDGLLQQRNENAEPEPIVEDPPSAALEGLLDLDHIWGGEVGQSESSLAPPT